jgi:hypothetical protein
MDGNGASSMKLVRELLDSLDSRIEEALNAHGFSFSALSADEDGAHLRFERRQGDETDDWRIDFRLPRTGQPQLALLLGKEAAPIAALTLLVDGVAVPSLAAALAAAMTLFAGLQQE